MCTLSIKKSNYYLYIHFRYSDDFGRLGKQLTHPNVGLFNHLRGISVVHGNLKDLSAKVSK